MRNRVNWRDQPKIKDFRHFIKVNGKITPSIGDHFFEKNDIVVYESFDKDGMLRYKEIMVLENTIPFEHDIEYLYRLRCDKDGCSFIGPNDLPQEARWRNWHNRGVVREPYRNELRSFFRHLHRSIIKEERACVFNF